MRKPVSGQRESRRQSTSDPIVPQKQPRTRTWLICIIQLKSRDGPRDGTMSHLPYIDFCEQMWGSRPICGECTSCLAPSSPTVHASCLWAASAPGVPRVMSGLSPTREEVQDSAKLNLCTAPSSERSVVKHGASPIASFSTHSRKDPGSFSKDSTGSSLGTVWIT